MSVKTTLASQLLSRDGFAPFARIASKLLFKISPNFLHIDEPSDLRIDREVCLIQGWFTCGQMNGSPSLRAGGVDLTWVRVERPDVKRIIGNRPCNGFRAIIDLNQVEAGELILELVADGNRLASKQLTLASGLHIEKASAARSRKQKHDWLRQHLRCPVCHAELTLLDCAIRCNQCARLFEHDETVFNFLPEEFKGKFQIEDWTDVSAHQYDDVATAIISEVKQTGGKVLDCGSGVRGGIDETVICLDVAALPTVDVLAVNQQLPFGDAVFDAVFSLNVLEHVTDPFRCAAELVRVLKPGGRLYCCIPFLQPEHGYPRHYFNATRSGLRQLFPTGLDLLQHFVPGSGEPVWTLSWFLNWYARELPDREKQRFLDLRIRDITEQPVGALLDESWVTRLSEKGKWELASTTAAIFKKA